MRVRLSRQASAKIDKMIGKVDINGRICMFEGYYKNISNGRS